MAARIIQLTNSCCEGAALNSTLFTLSAAVDAPQYEASSLTRIERTKSAFAQEKCHSASSASA